MNIDQLQSPEVADQAILELQARQDATNLQQTSLGTGGVLAITSGGTGSTTAAGARANLGAAPYDATYIVQTANAELVNEQVLSVLSTGFMTVTTGTGVIASRTITAHGDANLTVTNGDGAAGNPTLNTIQGIKTTSTPRFAGLGIGRAAGTPPLMVLVDDAVTGAASEIARVTHMTIGTATDNIAARLAFSAERIAGTEVLAAYIDGILTDGTNVSSALAFFTRVSAGALTERVRIDANGNVGIGTSTFGTSATKTLALFNGTVPSTSPADTVQLFSVDASAGNATLGLRTEAAVVTESVVSDRTLQIVHNGTVYKLCLKV